MTDEPVTPDRDEPCDRDGCDGRHCHICGTCEGLLIERYMPSASGPGGSATECTACLLLPADPDVVPPAVDEILARKAQQR